MKLNNRLKQLFEDKEFDKWYTEYKKHKPSKSKIRLYIDRNLPLELINEIKAHSQFKIIKISKPTDEDTFIYSDAKKEKAILVTGDEDFWNDTTFPLQESSGVIIVKGVNATEMSTSLALFLFTFDIPDAMRRNQTWSHKQKIRASLNGFKSKFITYESKIEIEEVEYD